MSEIETLEKNIITFFKNRLVPAATAAGLPVIQEFDHGLRDVYVGLRSYPAMIVVDESTDDTNEQCYSTHHITGAIVLKSDDVSQLTDWANQYRELMEKMVRKYWDFDGAVNEVKNLKLKTSPADGIIIIDFDFDVDVDVEEE
jgi:hypothetical protein